MDKMTLTEYLNFVDKDAKNKSRYSSRYSKIRGDITSKWYSIKDSGNVVVVIKIPSEKAKHVYYSVILEFPATNKGETAKKLLSSEMRVFSNCPSFTFMNAKYFEEKGFLVSWAKNLYDPRVFEDPEEEKEAKREENAQKEERDVKCEKSLYYAASYIKSMSIITILTNMNKATVVRDTSVLLKHIKTSDESLNKRLKQAKKNPLMQKKIKSDMKKPDNSMATKKVKKVPKTSTVKKVSKIKHI